MSITIGEHILATQRPVDLDAKLIAATGCTAAEHATMLEKGSAAPYQIARVLAPLLVEPIAMSELADMISVADQGQVVAEVRSLLAVPAVLPNTPAVEVQ